MQKQCGVNTLGPCAIKVIPCQVDHGNLHVNFWRR
jgi:hypothetical protein